jgi:hypothetical protein
MPIDTTRGPMLELEWLEARNEKILADYSPGSHEKVWWLCPIGHEYTRSIVARFKGGDCSFCSNDRVLAGFNDLQSQWPELAKEWSLENDVQSWEVFASSKLERLWTCNQNHSWSATPHKRTVLLRDCQFCADNQVWPGFNDLQSQWPGVAEYWSYENPSGCDEHLARSRKVVRWTCGLGHTWDRRIYIMLRDQACPFCEDKEVWKDFNSLSWLFPHLVKGLNKSVESQKDPSLVLARNTRVPLAWICEAGHEEAATNILFRAEFGCTACLKNEGGFSWPSVADVPRLFKFWSAKNDEAINIKNICATSSDTYWWDCERDHSWKASCYSLFKMHTRCPYCENKKIWPGFNDLVTTFPKVALEWDEGRNSKKTNEISAGSPIKFWWVCQYGHEWEASPSNRTRGRNGGTSCPVCTNRVVGEGYNDLATTHPELAEQWHPSKNGELRPEQTIFARRDPCWWICLLDHAWSLPPRMRMRGKNVSGCPFCTNQRLLTGFNDIQSRRPDLAKVWDFDKNLVSPSEVLAGTKSTYWWKCPNSHSFQSSVLARAASINNCPECLPLLGETGQERLAQRMPVIELEWDVAKNELTLTNALDSAKTERYMWLCVENGHSFKQRLIKRIYGHNCPYCSGKAVLVGFNDLETVRPELVREWSYENNKDITPQHVTSRSGKKVWWKCEVDTHLAWRATIAHRTDERPRGCKACSNSGFNPSSPGYLYLLRQEQWGLYKIGISNVPASRIRKHSLSGWVALEVQGPMDGYYTQELEDDLLHLIESLTLSMGDDRIAGQFDGYTETWKIDELPISGLADLRERMFRFEASRAFEEIGQVEMHRQRN